MADNLIQNSHKSGEKNKFNNVVHRTTTESLRLTESEKTASHPTSLQATHNPRKISSFQITSVTVGSRVSTDAGEDSADDLDESHTEDLSRVTDADTTPSHSEDTFSRDEVFYNASSAVLGCAPVIPTSSQYGLAIVGQESAAVPPPVPNTYNTDNTDMHLNVSQPAAGNINVIGNAKPQEGMKEIQEHVRNERFKVVKIESTEPFRRGRWMCMDYLDHTTTQPNAPITTINNNLDVSEAKTLQAPDSGVVINDNQHDEINDLNNRPKDQQGNPPIIQHLDQTIQKQFPMSSPGQSLTQPLNMVQQQLPVVSQPVSVQSPPIEMPQQMQSQSMAATQQVQQLPNQQVQQHPSQQVQQHPSQQIQQHPMQQVQQHPAQQVQQHPTQQVQQHPAQQVQQHPTQQVQQHPQSMSHITMQAPGQSHTQPQQQQVQQIPQSFPQHQLQQVITQQGIPVQQIPMHQQIPQQMQPLPNQQLQQMNQHMQQAQMPNLQMQQPMSQMQGLPQNQMAQVPTQQSQMQQIQMQQMQPQPNPQQLHQMQQAQLSQVHHLQGQQGMAAQPAQLQHLPSQAQIQAMQTQQIPNHLQQMQMPPQLTGAGQQMSQMQPQMHQMPNQPQQQVVQGMHPQMQQQSMPTVQPQYNQAVSQQSNQQAMINPNIQSAQQPMVQQQHSVPQYHTQPSQISQQGQTLPQEVLTNIATSQQGQTLPNNLQAMTSQQGGALQSLNQPMSQQGMMGLALDGSAGMQHMQPHVMGAYGLPHQNIPMSMQQNVPTMGVVQSQTSVALGYVPVMSQGSDPAVSGTNSPVVSLPAAYEPAGFGSPGNATTCVVSSSASESVPQSDLPTSELQQAPDTADGKEDQQTALQAEDESINGLALALGGSSGGSPAAEVTAASSRAPSPPPPASHQTITSASGTSAVAIDNKIEQAMDLVKSHLMFAVREEVEVLKERIAELMERINQLEVENSFLRAHASQDTLAQLPAAGTKPPPPQPPVS